MQLWPAIVATLGFRGLARIVADRRRAGETLMERASPELFDRMVRLYNACGERPVEMCEDGIIGRAAITPSETPPAKPNIPRSRPGAAR